MRANRRAAGPQTPLRAYYDALHTLTEQEQTAVAEAHASNPGSLARRFGRSIEAIADMDPIDEPFYPAGRATPPIPPTPVEDVRSTIEFASRLCDGDAHSVAGAAS